MTKSLFFAIVALVAANSEAVPQGRVSGGVPAIPYEFPFLAEIGHYEGSKYKHRAGGIIINQYNVLTNAVACKYLRDKDTRVVVGEHEPRNDEGQEQFIDVYDYKIHEQYADKPSYANNLCIISLASPIAYTSYVQPAFLPNRGQTFSGTATLVGWGAQRLPLFEDFDPRLQKLDVSLKSDSGCSSRYSRYNYDGATMMCAGGVNNDGACPDDRGTPLICHDGVLDVPCGIFSYWVGTGGRCADGNPDVFIELASYRDWIDANSK